MTNTELLEDIVDAIELQDDDRAKQRIRELQLQMDRSGLAPAVDAATLDFLLGVISDLMT